MDKDKKLLTKEQALDCLIIEDGQVHNFIQAGMGLIGADWSIEDVKECFEESTRIEIGGDNCRRINHGVVAVTEKQAYFFEADNEKLNKYDNQEE